MYFVQVSKSALCFGFDNWTFWFFKTVKYKLRIIASTQVLDGTAKYVEKREYIQVFVKSSSHYNESHRAEITFRYKLN